MLTIAIVAIAIAIGLVSIVTDAATLATTLRPAARVRQTNTAAGVVDIAVAPVSIVPGARGANTAADVRESQEVPVSIAKGARRANTAADVAELREAPAQLVPGAKPANSAPDVAELREAPAQLVPPASTRQRPRTRPVSHASAPVHKANIALVAA